MLVSQRVGTPFQAGLSGRALLPAAFRASAGMQRPQVVLSVFDDLAAIEADWRAFEKVADGTVFQSYDWQAAWLRNIGAPAGVTPAIVVGRAEGGEIVFLLPLAVEGRALVRRLTFFASDLCDYNVPLLEPGFAAALGADGFRGLWREIGRLLQADRRFRHHLVVLDKMPDLVGDAPNPMLGLGVSLNASGAYLAKLSGDWDSFYAGKRNASWRKRDRWKRKRLGDFGAVAVVDAGGPEEKASTLRTLFAQKARFFARLGVPDLFTRPGYADFFLDVATMPEMADRVHVSSLTVAGQAAATNLGLISGGRYYHVLVSYCEGELKRFGPGAVHLQELLRHAIARGCTLFDFTIGDEGYKREWADVTLKLHDHRAAATPRGLLMLLPDVARARAKRLVKQTPFLWRIAVKLRAMVGARDAKPETSGEGDDEQA